MALLSRDDSLLLVIDMQPHFWGERLDAGDQGRAREATRRAAWLAATARALGVPAVLTEEDPAGNGPTDSAILAALPPDAPVLTKPVFGVADCPDIMAAIGSTGRRTAVLTGFETDVCVTHSAIGLAEAGYRVVVVEDAVYSPFGAHAPGVTRLRDLGFELMRGKSVYYDWIRTLKAARAFQQDHPELAAPPGFSLLARNGPGPRLMEATMQPWSRRPG
jgi:nicotinamidase-related amidase